MVFISNLILKFTRRIKLNEVNTGYAGEIIITNNKFTDLVVGGVNYDGYSMNHSPKLTAIASWEHIFTLANGGTLSFHGDTRYQSINCIDFSKASDPISIDYVTEPRHHITGASIGYNNPYGKFKLSGYMKNLENYAEKTMAGGGGPPNLISSRQGMLIGAPKTWGVVLSINF